MANLEEKPLFRSGTKVRDFDAERKATVEAIFDGTATPREIFRTCFWLICKFLYSGISRAKYWTVGSGVKP